MIIALDVIPYSRNSAYITPDLRQTNSAGIDNFFREGAKLSVTAPDSIQIRFPNVSNGINISADSLISSLSKLTIKEGCIQDPIKIGFNGNTPVLLVESDGFTTISRESVISDRAAIYDSLESGDFAIKNHELLTYVDEMYHINQTQSSIKCMLDSRYNIFLDEMGGKSAFANLRDIDVIIKNNDREPLLQLYSKYLLRTTSGSRFTIDIPEMLAVPDDNSTHMWSVNKLSKIQYKVERLYASPKSSKNGVYIMTMGIKHKIY